MSTAPRSKPPRRTRRRRPSPRKGGIQAKKSVALSGVVAGNTALCTVGRSGNDLHYRGYDILDVADTCEFEEIAHLLVHGKLPTKAELKAYKESCAACAACRCSCNWRWKRCPPPATRWT